jgi:catechol 2,3-dioxygenase-like lactoylglutathione lyase family enzyme
MTPFESFATPPVGGLFGPGIGGRFNHLGVAVSDISSAIPFYTAAFGFVPLTDVFHDEIQQVRVQFIGPSQDFSDRHARGFVLELIEPAGEGSHLHRLLKAGGGAYHACFAVADIASALETLGRHGCLKVRGPDPAVAFHGQPIAWVYAPTRHLVELVQLPAPR